MRSIVKAAAGTAAAVLAAGLMGSCGVAPGEGDVWQAIKAANHCKEARECKVVDLPCPFTSNIVNVSEAARVADLADRYVRANGSCMESAMDNRDFSRISCTLGTCVAALKSRSMR